MEIYGKAYIKQNGTLNRVSRSGEPYTCPRFEIRVLSFSSQRDVLVVGDLDYTQAQDEFKALGYTRRGDEVPVTI